MLPLAHIVFVSLCFYMEWFVHKSYYQHLCDEKLTRYYNSFL